MNILRTVLRAARDASGAAHAQDLVVALLGAATAVSEDLVRTLDQGQARTSPRERAG